MSMNRTRLGITIGLVEDDPVTAQMVAAQLSDAGYDVQVYPTAKAFKRRLGTESVDLAILDWTLPDGTGLELLQQMRAELGAELPVIFLTARESPADVVAGLDAGADDYIVKPARNVELLARVRSALRRRGPAAPEELDSAPFVVDLRRRTVSRDGADIRLNDREFDLFAYLLRRAGRIVSRDSLLSSVWNTGPGVSTRTVDTYVWRLRKKLGLTADSGWQLVAVYQHGYRLARTSDEATEPA